MLGNHAPVMARQVSRVHPNPTAPLPLSLSFPLFIVHNVLLTNAQEDRRTGGIPEPPPLHPRLLLHRPGSPSRRDEPGQGSGS